MDVLKSQLNSVNLVIGRKEPWQIVAVSCMSTLFAVWTYQFLNKDEGE